VSVGPHASLVVSPRPLTQHGFLFLELFGLDLGIRGGLLEDGGRRHDDGNQQHGQCRREDPGGLEVAESQGENTQQSVVADVVPGVKQQGVADADGEQSDQPAGVERHEPALPRPGPFERDGHPHTE